MECPGKGLYGCELRESPVIEKSSEVDWDRVKEPSSGWSVESELVASCDDSMQTSSS